MTKEMAQDLLNRIDPEGKRSDGEVVNVETRPGVEFVLKNGREAYGDTKPEFISFGELRRIAENRLDIIDQDLNEVEYYDECSSSEEILLPLTRRGFESLLKRAAGFYALPVDNAMRSVLAGYVHHIPNEENACTIEDLAKVLYKAVSNSTTWRIDQEMKAEMRAQMALLKKESEIKAFENDGLKVATPEPTVEPQEH